MKTLRSWFAAAVAALLIAPAAAREADTFVFQHDAAPSLPGLPLMAWGPGSIASPSAVMGRLFPPTLIMQHQSELELSDAQQESIKAELREFQSRVVDVQWDLQAAQGELQSALAEDRIEPETATAAIERLLDAENALKKLHLGLLIRIRNVLDPEQIGKLETALRDRHRAWSMLAPKPPAAPAAVIER